MKLLFLVFRADGDNLERLSAVTLTSTVSSSDDAAGSETYPLEGDRGADLTNCAWPGALWRTTSLIDLPNHRRYFFSLTKRNIQLNKMGEVGIFGMFCYCWYI